MLALPCVVLSSLRREQLGKGLPSGQCLLRTSTTLQFRKRCEDFTDELNKKLEMHDAGLKTGKKADQLLEELEDTPYSVKYESHQHG